jgi:hypothetical protein
MPGSRDIEHEDVYRMLAERFERIFTNGDGDLSETLAAGIAGPLRSYVRMINKLIPVFVVWIVPHRVVLKCP